MNEFELMKYYRKFNVQRNLGLSYNGFLTRVGMDADYRRDVEQGVIAYRSAHVKQRVLEGTPNFG